MNKNGVVAVVVVVVAVVLIGLWAMRSGQQNTSGRMDCNAAPVAPTNLSHTKKGDVVTLNWTASGGRDAVTTYVVEVGSTPGANNVALFVVPGPITTFERQAPAGAYHVRILARNACGTSAPSNEILATVP